MGSPCDLIDVLDEDWVPCDMVRWILASAVGVVSMEPGVYGSGMAVGDRCMGEGGM